MINKKADSLGFQFIVVLAITIIFAFMYLFWLNDFRIFGENLGDYTICKDSNIENAKLKLKIDNQVIQERKGNKCKTEYLNVPKGKELEQTAKKMAACWDIYLEGKEELFDTEDNNYCAICSVLTFEDKKQVSGLTKYLTEHDAPGKGKKYYQYLTRTVVTNDIFNEIENSHLNDLHTIDASKPLAVIFTMDKNVHPGNLLTGQSSIVTAAEGAALGGIIVGLSVKLGFGLCVVGLAPGCIAGAFIVTTGTVLGVGIGAASGYMIGSNYRPNTDTKILLWSYTNKDLSQLKCTMLEGKDRLDIKKF